MYKLFPFPFIARRTCDTTHASRDVAWQTPSSQIRSRILLQFQGHSIWPTTDRSQKIQISAAWTAVVGCQKRIAWGRDMSPPEYVTRHIWRIWGLSLLECVYASAAKWESTSEVTGDGLHTRRGFHVRVCLVRLFRIICNRCFSLVLVQETPSSMGLTT